MRNVSSQDAPSLFPPEMLTDEPAVAEVPLEPNSSGVIARDFVRWCWSFDENFRNSPDITNFRFWLKKCSHSMSSSEEDLILVEARRLFLKRVEQSVRKKEASPASE